MKIDSILFPTDFSVTTKHTADFAADLALRYGARVYILHVVYDIARDSGWYGTHIGAESLYEDVSKNALQEVDRIASAYFPDELDTESVVRIGIPYGDILVFAEEKDIDLIVIGSHGKKGLDRVLFGSTVQKVIRKAKCPVLTVRERP
jgi:nucleotide-binding universal stress UspA family protein